jgi:hypothetical protein
MRMKSAMIVITTRIGLVSSKLGLGKIEVQAAYIKVVVLQKDFPRCLRDS